LLAAKSRAAGALRFMHAPSADCYVAGERQAAVVPRKAMNTPARFETLLWMASPMAAWAQASAEAPPKPVLAKKARAQQAPGGKPRRTRKSAA
jgi:hypothetical protein